MSKLKVWLNSGANIHSCRKETFTFAELGLTEAEWDEMSESEQEELARELAFAHSDWGFVKVEDGEDE